jgi:hypothetical protein
MICSPARREATPASAKNFCKRTTERNDEYQMTNCVPFVIRYSTFLLHVRLGFTEAGDAVAFLPLAAFLENFDALEALENIALATQGGRRAQTAML